MTEEEWQTCADPRPMMEFLRDQAGDRKLRLFACACCQRIWYLLTEEGSRRAVLTAEAVIDTQRPGRLHDAVISEARNALDAASFPFGRNSRAAYAALLLAEGNPVAAIGFALDAGGSDLPWKSLLSDVFGNPFRPVVAAPSWLTSTVLDLAKGIYEDGAFDRLPILADALQDAGCDNDGVLAHCRGDGPHARGCWVVDLLLARPR